MVKLWKIGWNRIEKFGMGKYKIGLRTNMKNSSREIRIANACFPFLIEILSLAAETPTKKDVWFLLLLCSHCNLKEELNLRKKSRCRSNTKKRTSYSGDSSSFPSSSSCCQPRPPGSDLKRNLLKLVVTNAELSVGGAAAADPLWLAHRPRLPLHQRWQAHQACLSHHTGQLLSRNITKPDAVRIEDPAAAPSAKRDTQVKF